MFSGVFVNADLIQRDELASAHPEASYEAVAIAAQRRSRLIDEKHDFATETVFSHPSKLQLLAEARAAGYDIIVMHVGVEIADLSVARVHARVTEGGHTVPESKIRARFDRNGPIIRMAIQVADMGMVFDNSALNMPLRRVILFRNGRIVAVDREVPTWIATLYRDDLTANAPH